MASDAATRNAEGHGNGSAIRVAMLAVPPNSASGLYGMRDVLNSVGIGWENYVTGERGAPAFEVYTVAASPKPFVCGSGAPVQPDFDIRSAPAPDVVIASGMYASATERITSVDPAVIDWIADQHAAGRQIASSCTGAILLAEAGLLDGIEATTHWAFRDLFRRLYPRVNLRLEQNLCCSGPDHRIVTSGGTTMWQHLALYLIARHVGVRQAAHTAKFWLLPNRGDLQAPYVAMPKGIPHDDGVIARCQEWIVSNYMLDDPVARMTAQSGLARSTFRRRFVEATGFQPIDYVQTVRIEEAKQLLEATEQSLGDIAAQVGYEDAASFRRLFKRRTGLTPAEHRRQFGADRFAGFV